MAEREKIETTIAKELLHAGIDCPLEAARIALTALEASGMAVVPREPTEAMVDAGGSSIIRPSVYMGGVPPGAKRRARDIWADMLAASPTPLYDGECR